VNAYMDADSLWEDKKGALFRTIHKQVIDGERQLTDRAMERNDCFV